MHVRCTLAEAVRLKRNDGIYSMRAENGRLTTRRYPFADAMREYTETSASDRRQTSGGNPVCVCATVRLGQIEPIRDEKEIQRHGVICYLIKKYRITISIRKLSCNFVDFPIACNKYKYNEDEEFFQDFRSRFVGVFRGNDADVVRAVFDYRRDCRLLRTAAGVRIRDAETREIIQDISGDEPFILS